MSTEITVGIKISLPPNSICKYGISNITLPTWGFSYILCVTGKILKALDFQSEFWSIINDLFTVDEYILFLSFVQDRFSIVMSYLFLSFIKCNQYFYHRLHISSITFQFSARKCAK